LPSLPVIVFIPCSGVGCKPGEYDAEWLPRQCPVCEWLAVIGHGRRWRQAHDDCHDLIRVRRGLCKHCDLTLTVLPAWCVPGALYNLPARREALGRLAEGETLEESAPVCHDPDRIADPATIRRWFWRRMASLRFFFSPTILAWDFRAAARILAVEHASP
jgi:Domain of unknown function (DUF6431)